VKNVRVIETRRRRESRKKSPNEGRARFVVGTPSSPTFHHLTSPTTYRRRKITLHGVYPSTRSNAVLGTPSPSRLRTPFRACSHSPSTSVRPWPHPRQRRLFRRPDDFVQLEVPASAYVEDVVFELETERGNVFLPPSLLYPFFRLSLSTQLTESSPASFFQVNRNYPHRSDLPCRRSCIGHRPIRVSSLSKALNPSSHVEYLHLHGFLWT